MIIIGPRSSGLANVVKCMFTNTVTPPHMGCTYTVRCSITFLHFAHQQEWFRYPHRDTAARCLHSYLMYNKQETGHLVAKGKHCFMSHRNNYDNVHKTEVIENKLVTQNTSRNQYLKNILKIWCDVERTVIFLCPGIKRHNSHSFNPDPSRVALHQLFQKIY